MSKYECKEISPGNYEVSSGSGNRVVVLNNLEVNAILDYFRERNWEAGIRDAIIAEGYDEGDLDIETLVADCLDEIRNEYEIYGGFNENYKAIIESLMN